MSYELEKPVATIADTKELVMLLKGKDREAFSALYDKYAAALFGFISRIVRSNHVAEDLLQDVFVKIWRTIDSYEPARGALFTWMVSIARNTCIDHLRSRQYKTAAQTSAIPDFLESFAIMFSETHNTENKDLHNLSQKLDEKHRRIIDMLYFMGYSQKEVAEELDIPLGTVKTRSRAALIQLRKMIQKKPD
jgi:RNA polymerase sigma-70 factor (ECF subfamily)